MKVIIDENYKADDRILDLSAIIECLLPTGGGINGEWVIQQDKSSNLYAYNTYTCYTEHGILDDYCDFYIKIKLVNVELHITELHFSGSKAQYLNNKYMLREYLESMFFDSAYMQDYAMATTTLLQQIL